LARQTKERSRPHRASVTSQSVDFVSRFAQSPITIFADDAVQDAAKLMCEKQVGSVIVSEKTGGAPIGMLTEWDLVSRVIAPGKDVAKTTVRQVMSSPLIKIDASASLGDALRLMTNRGIRRLAVFEDGVLAGVVAQNQIIGNRRRTSSAIPIVEPLKGHLCPYCNQTFANRRSLSTHIESIHSETLVMLSQARKESEL
jgi:signal-transduction protein with cAMP-binding, CBS, and nucleotidyltransferase domain